MTRTRRPASARRLPPARRRRARIAAHVLTIAALAAVAALVVPAGASAAKLRELYTHDTKVESCKFLEYEICLPVRASSADAERVLRRCFNCTFPVSGAPRRYPRQNQRMPLKACILPKVCDAPVRFRELPGKGIFAFRAERGHFDGAGSRVSFRFYADGEGHLRLRVIGLVANPKVPDVLNRAFAKAKWNDFARNMGEELRDW